MQFFFIKWEFLITYKNAKQIVITKNNSSGSQLTAGSRKRYREA